MSGSKEIMISKAGSVSGSIQISGSKNASLPCMAACLLTNQEVTLENIPDISDIDEMKKQLESYGVRVNKRGSRRTLQAGSPALRFSPTSDEGSKTRGSFLVLGPLLARLGKAEVYQPGGCQIVKGGRPVDFHIDALRQMGADVSVCSGYVSLEVPRDQRLHGAEINLPQISVGATENVIMAACLADGQTIITNAAVEPEVIDLIDMLKAMGMNGYIGVFESENKIVINGRGGRLLNGCTHTVIPDRIEAGTWAIAVAITGGSLLLKMDRTVGEKIMVPIVKKLEKAGVGVQWKPNGLQVQREAINHIRPVDIITGPFPHFPTDLLPQWVILMTQANGPSVLEDTIYDNRFSHVPHLQNMGAKFTKFSDQKYRVHGNARLEGCHVTATDLRAGAALILAGLIAKGATVVKEFQHVLRGYENIEEKLEVWKAKFHPLPQTRRGHHGGNLQQVQYGGGQRR